MTTSPRMTRAHFALIAEEIRQELPDETKFPNSEYARGIRNVAYGLAGALASTNPNFNRARFLRACGVED